MSGLFRRYDETDAQYATKVKDHSGVTADMNALEKRLSTPGAIPYPAITEQAAWLRLASPSLYEWAPQLEAAGLWTRTENAFDFQCTQASLLRLLAAVGLVSWQQVAKYFLCKGKMLKANSLKNQVQTATGKTPRDWHRVVAVIPELNRSSRLVTSR